MQFRTGVTLFLILITGTLCSCCIFSATISDLNPGDQLAPMETQTTVVTGVPAGSFSAADRAYFENIVLGTEYGFHKPQVYKWVKNPVTIRVYGTPDEQSRECLNDVLQDFNQLSTTTKLQTVNSGNGDIDMYFVPDSRFPFIEPNYIPGNWGFFWVWPASNCEISRARILISTIKPSPAERCHLIREELTQSLGFGKDSLRYPDSIFYQEWTETTRYSDIDKNLIRMLYATGIPACTTRDDVDRFFHNSGNNSFPAIEDPATRSAFFSSG
jgi:hypothetical protein